jgi:hypothetical protein
MMESVERQLRLHANPERAVGRVLAYLDPQLLRSLAPEEPQLARETWHALTGRRLLLGACARWS